MKNQIKFFIALGVFLGSLSLNVDVKAADEESLDTVYVTTVIDNSFGSGPFPLNDCNSVLGVGTNCSIRQALRVVKSGGSIIVPAGDYCLKSSLGGLQIIDKSVTLTGAGTEAGSATVIGYKPYDSDGDGIADSSTYLTGCSDDGTANFVMSIDLTADTSDKVYQVKVNGIVVANGIFESDYVSVSVGGLEIKSSDDGSLTGGVVDVDLANVMAVGNKGALFGAGISVFSDISGTGTSTVSISDDVTVTENTATNGGGISVYSNVSSTGTSTVSISDGVTVTENTANIGGGINVYSNVSGTGTSTVSISDGVTVTENTAGDKGGGIRVHSNISGAGTSTVSISDGVTVTENTAGDKGGGIRVDSNISGAGTSTVSISDGVTVTGNTANNGGGIYVYSNVSGTGTSTVSISDDVNVTENTAGKNGGGVYLYIDPNSNTISVNLDKINVSNNTSVNRGGGIYIDANEVTSSDHVIVNITNSIIEDNKTTASDSYGAGLGVNFYGTGDSATLEIQLKNSSILNNTSAGSGGGIGLYTESDSETSRFSFEIINSTLSGNIATSYGGAIYMDDSDVDAEKTLILKQSTIYGNNSGDIGGGIATVADVETFGTIIQNNTAGEGYASDNCFISTESGGSFVSKGYNAFLLTTCVLSGEISVTSIESDITTDLDLGISAIETDSVTNQSYYPLKEGSVLADAIPAEDCDLTITSDQIGTTRPQGTGCDIGSYEKAVITGGGSETGEESGTSGGAGTTGEAGSGSGTGEESGTSGGAGTTGEVGSGSGTGEESGTSGGAGTTGEAGSGSGTGEESASDSTSGSTTTGSSETGGQGSENQGEGGGGCSFQID